MTIDEMLEIPVKIIFEDILTTANNRVIIIYILNIKSMIERVAYRRLKRVRDGASLIVDDTVKRAQE